MAAGKNKLGVAIILLCRSIMFNVYIIIDSGNLFFTLVAVEVDNDNFVQSDAACICCVFRTNW